MFIAYMLQWWYGPGWLAQWKKIIQRAKSVGGAYSGKTLLKTLFAPWKRITALKPANPTIQQRLQGVVDNLVSRFVGFIVRVFTLMAAVVSLLFIVLFGLALAIIWPVLPLLSVAVAIKGLGVI